MLHAYCFILFRPDCSDTVSYCSAYCYYCFDAICEQFSVHPLILMNTVPSRDQSYCSILFRTVLCIIFNNSAWLSISMLPDDSGPLLLA
jgi:hypothetical protein